MSNLDEIRERCRVLVAAEQAKARAKGATDEDLRKNDLIVTMAKAVTTALRAEFGPDQYTEFYKEERDSFIANASVEQLRAMAVLHRAAGEGANALDTTFIADYREWQERQ